VTRGAEILTTVPPQNRKKASQLPLLSPPPFSIPIPTSTFILPLLTNLSTARLATHNRIPPRRLVQARTTADIIAIAVRVAVPDREAVREARQALRDAVDVAGDALLQARHDGGVAAADSDWCGGGGGVVELDLWVGG
jgi:hypothetical protein